MQEAFYNLYGIHVSVRPTHFYVKFLPKNAAELAQLAEDELELFDYPLDYEVLSMGDFYRESGKSIEDYHWLYTWVPVRYNFRSNIQYEHIDNLALNLDFLIPGFASRAPNVSFDDLEYESLKLTNNLDEDEVKNRSALVRYKPKGRIKVRDTELGDVGVKRVLVKSRRWFKTGKTYTNDNGYFEIDKEYRKKADIVVVFKNDEAKIRGVRGFRVWQIFQCVRHNLGQYEKGGLTSIDYTYRRSEFNTTESQRRWMAATTMNAFREMHAYCTQNNLPAPLKNLNVWLTNQITSHASAPMLKKMGNTSLLNNIMTLALIPLASPITAATKKNLESICLT